MDIQFVVYHNRVSKGKSASTMFIIDFMQVIEIAVVV